MTTGLPCVLTDIGDSADIVGETGWVVEPKNTEELVIVTQSDLDAMKDDPTWLARYDAARKPVETNSDLGRVLATYSAHWDELLDC